MSKLIILLILVLSIQSCDSSKLKETPINQFKGTWRLEGRSILDSVEIKIITNDKGELKGKVFKKNKNKFVELFLDEGETFVSSIERKSNFEFILKEKKVAHQLFGMYDLSTSQEYKVKFLSKDTIQLNEDIFYIRVN